LFDSFCALCNRLAPEEDDLQADCENERELIAQLYKDSKNCGPFFVTPLIVATRVRARINYAKMNIAEPSLEIGIGTGLTARFILSDRHVNIGSDLFIHDLVEAKGNGAPYGGLMAFDMMNIPFLNNTFGSVFSIHSIYHAEDKITAIREMARVCSPGGTLCFDDVSSNVVSERPFVLALNDLRVFPKSANDFVRSILKPQRYLEPDEYREILRDCGCDDVEVIPSISLPLLKIIYFFYDLQRFFEVYSVLPSERRAKSLKQFLDCVIAPLLARDRELCEKEGAGFWFVHGTKRGHPDLEGASADVIERAVCPACRSRLVFVAGIFHCTSCATKFPVVNGIPILSTAYFPSFNELIEKGH